MDIHWHRRDIRATDNHGLARAASSGTVLPVFVFDPEVLEYASPVRVSALLDSLATLREWYRNRGSDLVIAEGAPRVELPRIASEHAIERVVWNRDYSGLARERDGRVSRALDEAGLSTESVHDLLLHEPGSITTNEGQAYAIYSYFWRKWREREKAAAYSPPSLSQLATVDGETLPTIGELGFDPPEATVPPVGMSAARDCLETFTDGPIYQYEAERETPSRNATSRLSPHLKWGTIGIRDVYEEVERAKSSAPDSAGAESCETFVSQLAWREFYTHVLDAHPGVVTSNYREYANPIGWRRDPTALEAWKDGKTGYPIVDAGMRQLRAEAFMHNRVRMIVASFLTKDLLIDWREGYDWFRKQLVDHEPANDTGGWQWAAGTGTDAQPYFRIFNPMTQGKRHDPDARYIKRYVAELRDVPVEDIHGWDELSPDRRNEIAPSYPPPIVDHSKRREQALEMFEAAREDS